MMVSAQVSGLQEYVRNHCRLAKLFEQKVLTDPRFQVWFKSTSELKILLVFFGIHADHFCWVSQALCAESS